jgi:hypothetical protein
VAGEPLDDALAVALNLNAHGIGGTLDLLGEGSPIWQARRTPSSSMRKL